MGLLPPYGIDPGIFAPWFDATGRLPDATRTRMMHLVEAFRLDDIAIVPARGDIMLVGRAQALLNMLKSPGRWWRRTLARVCGEEHLWLASIRTGEQWQKDAGHWTNIDPVAEPEVVDWMQFNDHLPDAFTRAAGAPTVREAGTGYPTEFDVVVVPRPGGPDVPWYSVKRASWMPPVRVTPYDVCTVRDPEPYGSADGPVRLDIAEVGLFTTHVLGIDDLVAAVKCGGLLWPSFAVSWQMHRWSGDLVFFLDAGVVARQLHRPGWRAPRRRRNVVLTNTDTWTPRVGEVLEAAKLADAELRGRKEMRGNWLDVLGPRIDLESGFVSDEAKLLSTRGGLLRRMRHLRRVHGDDWHEVDIAYEQRHDKYPYVEMKIADLVRFDACPLCIVHREVRPQVRRLLSRAGWHGVLLDVDAPPDADKMHTGQQRTERTAFVHTATDAARVWAQKNNRVLEFAP